MLTKNWRGGPAGTVQHIMSDINSSVIVTWVLTIFIRAVPLTVAGQTISHTLLLHSQYMCSWWMDQYYNLTCYRYSGTLVTSPIVQHDEVALVMISITLRPRGGDQERVSVREVAETMKSWGSPLGAAWAQLFPVWPDILQNSDYTTTLSCPANILNIDSFLPSVLVATTL